MQQPTVILTINTPEGPSFMAFNESNEIIETNEITAGQPDWPAGGICDARGGAGDEGFKALHAALNAGEMNARLLGLDVQRIPA